MSELRHAALRGETLLGALVALVLLCLCATVKAQEDPYLVSLQACSEGARTLDVVAMLELARAELGGGLVQLTTPASGALAITQDCATGDLELSRTGTTLPTQHVRLSDVPVELRARVGALALSEYALSTLEAERKTKPEQAAEPAQPAPPRRPLTLDPELLKPPVPETGPPQTWSVGPEARLFVLLPSIAVGGRASFTRERLEWTAFGLFQSRGHALGTVSVGVIGLGLAGVIAQSQGRIHLSLAFGGELGVTWGKGDAKVAGSGGSAVRPFASALMWISLGGRMGERALGRVRLGFGYALGIEAQVQGKSLATSGGPLATLVVAFGASR